MAVTLKGMIKQNNEKQKVLTPENAKYYENMLVHLRTNAFRNEREIEELLLETLNRLIEAQKDGKNVEDIFDKTPQQLAEGIIQSLPKEKMRGIVEFGLEIALSLFGWCLIIFGGLPVISQQDQTVHLGSLAVSSILLLGCLFVLLYTIFVVIRKTTFTNQQKKKRAAWVLGILAWLLLVAVFLLNFIVKPFGPPIEVTYYTGFGLGCFFLLAAYILKKSREAKK